MKVVPIDEEQRVDPRVTALWPVDALDKDGRQYLGSSKNISMGGIQVYFDLNFGNKARLRLRVRGQIKKKPASMEFVAVVVHTVLESSTGRFCTGLKFINCEGESKDQLSKYVALKS